MGDDDDGGLRRRLLDGGLVLLCAPFVAASLIVLYFYVLGNGVNDGALATLPVLLLAGPYLLANPQHQRRGAIALHGFGGSRRSRGPRSGRSTPSSRPRST